MAIVNILVQDGSLSYAPPRVRAAPGGTITWHLLGANNWTYQTGGVEIDTQPPTGYTPYPASGAQPQPVSGNPNAYEVTLPPDPFVTYKYAISLQNGVGGTMVIDPDIGNDPGGMMDGGVGG